MDAKPLQAYLVGGAVRDQLLGQQPKERDWVVVGSTPSAMSERGFRPVGRDFPVFLHPQTGEEYALARTERKSGHGYQGFTFFADEHTSLEQDLQRRDLTINAMAQTAAGEIIDPFGGRADLDARLLRHVSAAFSEDPLRILRVARFAARFHAQGFRVANETLGLMRRMAVSGELDYLSAERVWQETLKALQSDHPEIYFQVLRQAGALQRVYPELDALFGVPQPAKHHPEIDAGIHSLMALQQVSRMSSDPVCRFATLVHDLGKARTPSADWPRHIGHEEAGVKPIEQLCRRLGIGKTYSRLAVLVSRWHLHSHRALALRPDTLLRLFDGLDIWRRPQTLDDFLLCCEADARGRAGLEQQPYPQRAYLYQAGQAALAISRKDLEHSEKLAGKALGYALQEQRLTCLEEFKSRWTSN